MVANGHDAEHVFDFGGDGTTDAETWTRASDTAAIILTKDEDFSVRALCEPGGPQIVWVRVGNTRRAALLMAAIERGERVIEIA
ncbi:DUF5615 family PIN-like protein [Thermochromatium tepidum]|uniref:DUF5615 family PIN-like protein n=1 Tax=Thermochromatium tepidum TaxID=1050 RepID=UPI001389A9E4